MKVLVLPEAGDAPDSVTVQGSLNPRGLKVWLNSRSCSLPWGYKEKKKKKAPLLWDPTLTTQLQPDQCVRQPKQPEAFVVCIPTQKHHL